MESFFYQCVHFLDTWADKLNTTYEAINIWLFVVIQPALILIFFILFLVYFIKYRKLQS